MSAMPKAHRTARKAPATATPYPESSQLIVGPSGPKPAPKRRVNSRRKGADGEREFANLLTAHGFTATRGQQHRGGSDSPDVFCMALHDIHWEVKRTATCQMFSPAQLAQWDDQARRDAAPGKKQPIIVHRWNGGKWWVRVLPYARRPVWQTFEDFIQEVHAWRKRA